MTQEAIPLGDNCPACLNGPNEPHTTRSDGVSLVGAYRCPVRRGRARGASLLSPIRRSTMTQPDWQSLPEGHYAIVDPHDPEQVTYWRRKDVTTRSGGCRPEFSAYPRKARNGPVLLTRDVPKGLDRKAKFDWVKAWHEEHAWPYRAAVIEAIAADPIVAGQRFADFTSSCCSCARALTDPHPVIAEHLGIPLADAYALTRADLVALTATEIARTDHLEAELRDLAALEENS